MRTKAILLCLVVGLIVLAVGSSQAQIVFGRTAAADIGVTVSSWDVEDSEGTTEISQTVLPLRGFVPLGENTEGLFYVATANNQLTRGGATDYTLSGLSDVRMQFNRSFSDDQLLLSIGLNLPTGKKELTLGEEAAVLDYLARDFLDLPLRRLGEGLGFSAMVGGARMLGDIRAGASVMYRYNGKYDPYEGVTGFDPGDLVSLTIGLDRQMDATALSAEIIYSMYGVDKLEGDGDVFKQSTQLSLRGGIAWEKDANHVSASLGYLARGRNTTYAETETDIKIYGNEFWMAAAWGRDFAEYWRFTPSLTVRMIAENEQELGSATVIRLGGTIGRRLSDQVGLDLGVRYYTGEADGGDLDLSGYQIRVGLSANL